MCGERGRGEDQTRTKQDRPRANQQQADQARAENKDRTPEQGRPEPSGVPGRVPRRPGAGVSRRPGTPRDASGVSSWRTRPRAFRGRGERSVGQLLANIEASKQQPLPRLLIGLGIHRAGRRHLALRRGPIAARRERNGRTRTKPCTHQAAAPPHSIPTASAQDRRQVALKARAGERVPRPCFARGREMRRDPRRDRYDPEDDQPEARHPRTSSKARRPPHLRPPGPGVERTAHGRACGYESPMNRRCSPADGVAQVHERNARCVGWRERFLARVSDCPRRCFLMVVASAPRLRLLRDRVPLIERRSRCGCLRRHRSLKGIWASTVANQGGAQDCALYGRGQSQGRPDALYSASMRSM